VATLPWTETQVTLPQRGTASHQFSAQICCGQVARRINRSLCMEEGLGPGDFVLDQEPASPPKSGLRRSPSIFGRCLLWPSGSMDQDTTWYGGRPRPRRLCSMRTQLRLRKKVQPLNYWHISIVAKRLDG